MGILDFFTNEGTKQEEKEVVEAPAFSLTKVLATAAAVVAPITTVVLNEATDLNLSEWNWVALAIAVLGFLAVTASADVLARSIATAGQSRAKVAEAALARLLPFKTPLEGNIVRAGQAVNVQVLAAAQGAEPYFLVKEDKSITWLPASEVTVS